MTEMSRPLLPIPGIEPDALKKMSRQQRYKLRRYTEGLCTSCGKAQRCEESRTLCTDCLSVQRERMRQRTGAGRRNMRSKSYATKTAAQPAKASRKKGAKSPAGKRAQAQPTAGSSR